MIEQIVIYYEAGLPADSNERSRKFARWYFPAFITLPL